MQGSESAETILGMAISAWGGIVFASTDAFPSTCTLMFVARGLEEELMLMLEGPDQMTVASMGMRM